MKTAGHRNDQSGTSLQFSLMEVTRVSTKKVSFWHSAEVGRYFIRWEFALLTSTEFPVISYQEFLIQCNQVILRRR
jgi:hypothetical protein